MPSATGRHSEIISRDTALIDEAVDLLFRFDPERHHPRDFVMTIGAAILGRPLARYDAKTWTDEGVEAVLRRRARPSRTPS